LEQTAKRCRLNCLEILESSGVGHAGGSMSVIDILVALYFHSANISPSNIKDPLRDRVIFSKAHSCEGMYAVLGEAKFFPRSEFQTYGTWGSRLQGHAEAWALPGVEFSGGLLGQGLSFGIGIALAARLNNAKFKVFCVMGDGECQEGQVWEAVQTGATYKLNNLIAIVDDNKYATVGVTNLEPLAQKWSAFGWNAITVDGHDTSSIINAIEVAKTEDGNGYPWCIVANTIKGKGIPSWEASHAHTTAGESLAKGLEEGRRLFL